MIGSFILSAILLIAASLSWGFVFSIDVARFGRRPLSVSLVVSIIISIFAAIFFLRGLPDLYGDLEVTTSSLAFTVTFALVLVFGFGLSIYSETAKIFSYAERMIKGVNEKEDRSDIIDEILDRTTESGEINVLERELIESVLKFNDKIVREIMIPRGDVVAIDVEEESRRSLRKVIEEGYSRLPVYRGSIDNVVGIIYAKDLLTMVENGAVIILHDLLRPPYYVPETKKISQLLRDMQKDKIHLAVVVDEFGGTEGIITLEDVLEEIVGEIQDEYDENLSEIVRDENGEVHISGSMTVNRFNELLEQNIPQGDDYDTMAGFVQKLAGKLPQKNDVYNHEEVFFGIEEVARHRIKRLKISYKEHPAGFITDKPPNSEENALINKKFSSSRDVRRNLHSKAKKQSMPMNTIKEAESSRQGGAGGSSGRDSSGRKKTGDQATGRKSQPEADEPKSQRNKKN
ncbi:MAG: hemolysin family protein [Candidatus Kryptoniota bacterium]